ncbi:MAG: hypothetical protein PHP45_06700, partial [Elusimicrobiales bacterium]|nr:hypothetical protein [Elusimicrobiales bacterium]
MDTSRKIGFSIAAAVALLSGCAGPQVYSRWPARPIAIDGVARDWMPDSNAEDSGFEFAVANDDKNLYIYVSPKTESSKTLLASAFEQNFTVWIDPAGQKNKNTGFRLVSPESASKGRRNAPRPGNSEMPPSFGAGGQPRESAETAPDGWRGDFNEKRGGGRRDGVRVSTGSIKLMGFSEEDNSLLPAERRVEVSIGNVRNRGVLEARIPLGLLGAQLPGELSLGFEADALPAARGGTHVGGNGSGKPFGGGRSG